MTFPILKLPFLALKNVIECGENVGILKMSLCSRKANRAVKLCRKNLSIFNLGSKETDLFNHFEQLQLLLSEAGSPDVKEKLNDVTTSLEIVVSNVLSLSFCIRWPVMFQLNIDAISQMEKHEGYKKVLKLDGICTPFVFSNDQVYTFWDDRLQGLQFFVKYFESNFCLKECSWGFENSKQDLKPLVAYLNSMPNESEDGLGVEQVTVERCAKLSHMDYKYLLKTVTHELEAGMKVSRNFKFSGQYATKKLILSSAHWFTLKHLFECKCEYVHVGGSRITINQLKIFIRRWSDGEFSHFKTVRVELEKTWDLYVLLEGIKIVRVMPTRTYRRNAPPKMMIQGTSGDRAIIDHEYGNFVFKCMQRLTS